MPKIQKTLTRLIRQAQGEGAPHPPSSDSHKDKSDHKVRFDHNDLTLEIPQTPRRTLSLINPGNNINTRSGLTREIVLSDRPEYDDAANESRQVERKKILREMARSQDSYERSLGQAILIRTTLEEEEANLLTKSGFDKYDLEDLRRKISYAKTREKLLQEDYDRHRNEEDDEAKITQNLNSSLIIETIQKVLSDSGYWNMKLTPNTSLLYSYFTDFYKTYFTEKYGPYYFETNILTGDDMYDATNYVLSRLDKKTFEEKLDEAKKTNARKGGSKTKKRKSQKRGSKYNRKSRYQHK